MEDGPLKGLAARAIFVINTEGVITYKELVPEITEEPNYEAVLEAVKDTRL
jgi:thiol peroxidase